MTGRRAFEGATPAETMSAIVSREPPEISDTAPQVQVAESRVVRRCLEKNPAKRFQSAEDLPLDRASVQLWLAFIPIVIAVWLWVGYNFFLG